MKATGRAFAALRTDGTVAPGHVQHETGRDRVVIAEAVVSRFCWVKLFFLQGICRIPDVEKDCEELYGCC